MNSPFNEAKYNALLEGLEVKIKMFSETLGNKDFRIDSQYYTKEPLKNSKLSYDRIGTFILKAQYGISIEMNEDGLGYPIYRMNEIHNMLCDTEVSKFANISAFELKTFSLNDRDVVFNRTNSFEWVGRTGLYKKLDNRDFVFASYLVRFIPDQRFILPEYLTTFLNTKYGVNDIKRRARQSINQTNVNPEEVKEIEIPKLSLKFQEKLKFIFDVAFNNKVNSVNIYTQAEELLLKEIGLQKLEQNKDAVNIKSFSESFAVSGRLDAEYYQTKYDDILKFIESYRNGSAKLASVCNIKDKNYFPNDSTEYKYIELSNLGNLGEITDFTIDYGSALPTRARRILKTNDVIVSSIEGSLEKCALVSAKYNGALCSNGFYVLSSDKINSETLLILFKSHLIQSLLKKGCSGTILSAINKTEFENLLLPLIDTETQLKIKEKVKESFALRDKADSLLEIAKQAVELAIEKDEETAIKFINKQGVTNAV